MFDPGHDSIFSESVLVASGDQAFGSEHQTEVRLSVWGMGTELDGYHPATMQLTPRSFSIGATCGKLASTPEDEN